jgi:hypothetical protein
MAVNGLTSLYNHTFKLLHLYFTFIKPQWLEWIEQFVGKHIQTVASVFLIHQITMV